VSPTNPAFTFTPLQEELLQTALRRDGSTARRWAALRRTFPLDEIMSRKPRRLLPLVEDGVRREHAPADLVDRSVLQEASTNAARDHDARVAWVARLIDMLRDEGVEIVVLKGLSLALAYFVAPA
jgi:hypothetical protein